MRYRLLLAWRYVSFHRLRSGLLVACIALVLFLPIVITAVLGHVEDAMTTRARATPLAIGARGSRYDLVLAALYFRGEIERTLGRGELTELEESGLADAVPLLLGYRARGRPIVGTSLDYFSRRGLRLRSGSLPVMLGDVVLGAQAARDLELGEGDHLLSQVETIYDISTSYPLKMRVCGVLAEARSADDGAVFVDLRTAWIIHGIGHGHVEVTPAIDPALVMNGDDESVTLNEAVFKYVEVTDDNVGSFHFHGDPDRFPISAILAWPRDARSRTFLKGRYSASDTAQLLVPAEVVDELLGLVFRIKRVFDANVILVSVATALFLVLVVLLTLRLRQRELETLFKIGCSRLTVFWLQAFELALVLAAGLALALGLGWAVHAWVVSSGVVG